MVALRYQNYRRKHVDAVIKAKAHNDIKSSRSLVCKSPSLDSNIMAVSKGKLVQAKRSLQPAEPVL